MPDIVLELLGLISRICSGPDEARWTKDELATETRTLSKQLALAQRGGEEATMPRYSAFVVAAST